MEATFYYNDTPFTDRVRLPVAALWHGRVRLTGFESDVTTADLVSGPPGSGTLPNLTLTGSGCLVTHAPPSDQLLGMHLMFSLDGGERGRFDNSAFAVCRISRGGRIFLQTILIR
jgi:hypothetical protein